ncbi:hypothetical protein [Chamaesiphon sp.]
MRDTEPIALLSAENIPKALSYPAISPIYYLTQLMSCLAIVPSIIQQAL